MYYFYLKGVVYGKSQPAGGFLAELAECVSGFESIEEALIYKFECLSRVEKGIPGLYDKELQRHLLDNASIIEEHDLRFINAKNTFRGNL